PGGAPLIMPSKSPASGPCHNLARARSEVGQDCVRGVVVGRCIRRSPTHRAAQTSRGDLGAEFVRSVASSCGPTNIGLDIERLYGQIVPNGSLWKDRRMSKSVADFDDV